jgi:hypothetical protein
MHGIVNLEPARDHEGTPWFGLPATLVVIAVRESATPVPAHEHGRPPACAGSAARLRRRPARPGLAAELALSHSSSSASCCEALARAKAIDPDRPRALRNVTQTS